MSETVTRGGGVTTPHPTTKRAAAIAATSGVAALAFEAMLLTLNAIDSIPTNGPAPVYGLAAVIAAVTFGAAVGFGACERQPAQRCFATNARAAVLYVPGTWVLTSRWVYEHLHMIEGIDLGRLLRIESAFDIALIVAATAMAWALITKPRDKRHP